jgi:hypothetical protein
MFLPKIPAFPLKKPMKAAVLLAALLCLPAAHAEKTSKNTVEIERPDSLLTETDTFLSAPGQPATGKTLRCWQYGRLLYEGSGFSRLSSGDKTAITVNRQKGDGLNIINLQDGLCILSDN